MRRVAALACLLVGGLAGPRADPLKSSACGERLQALQAARAQGQGDVEALRRAATQACLGGSGGARRPSPTARAPVVVPPPSIDVPRIAAPAPAPPPVSTPPAVVTHCDASGCWDSNGAHLNRVGPLVVTPGGTPCIATAVTVQCP